MPYVDSCATCRVKSAPGPRGAAEDARRQHRDTEHGGLAPDGERINHVPGSTRHPDGRYVSSAGLLGLLLLLAVGEAVFRWFGG